MLNQELDIAIVKATNHVERPAKEKYIRGWHGIVALKTLIVIHRALREVDPTFREELINYGRSRNHMLNLAHFKDDSSAYGIHPAQQIIMR
ncbi:hypothetical protein BHE74_00013423 [Ensete ventricosum]|uniref:Uncharacterized protein n=1 Tax=Ensete ventricosum TaxID=4639 RepID=A0A444FXE9_ENSVE|nr:hypothetical protein B296_00031562 [Ensete ventricosum]RWW27316.1 hypothetical protein GW17_00008267 [Ensete ventricosum]RWW78353.1 hypothetical protein BHE74_00013423 [Ensete ventricosum]RZR95839.1 hypothetical protein BHM03_00024735 [Ensete ventricosum]